MLLLLAVGFTACEETKEPTNPNTEEPTPEPEPEPEKPIYAEGVPYVEFVSSTHSSVVVDSKLNGYEGTFYVTLYPKENFELEFADDTLALASAFLQMELNEWSGDLTTANPSVYDSEQRIDLSDAWMCYGDRDYVLFTFGMNELGIVTTDVAGLDIRTAEYPIAEVALTVNSTSTSGITVDVTPVDKEQSYFIFPYNKYDYESQFDAMPEGLVTAMASGMISQGIDPLTVDNIYSFVGDQSIDLTQGWSFEPNTEYVILAVHLDQNYSQSSKVSVLETKTDDYADIQGELASFTISDITYIDATITVDAGTFPGVYYIAPMLRSEFEEDFMSDFDALTKFMVEFEMSRGIDFTTPNGGRLHQGNSTYNLSDGSWYMVPDEEYFMVAFGVLPNGAITTELLVSDYFYTKSAAGFTVEIVVEPPTDNSVSFAMTPSVDDLTYIVAPLEKSLVDTMSNKQIEDAIEFYYGGLIETIGHLEKGAATKEFNGTLKSGTEYVAVGCAYLAGIGHVSDVVTKVPFTTTGIAVPDIEMPERIVIPQGVEFGEVTVQEITESTVEYLVEPANPEERYFCHAMTKTLYDRYTSMEELILSDLNWLYQDAIRENMTFGGILARQAKYGVLSVQNFIMYTDSGDYVIYAYGMDITTAQPTTEVKVVHFNNLDTRPAPMPALTDPTTTEIERVKAGRFPVESYDYVAPISTTPIDPSLPIEQWLSKAPRRL